MAACVQRIPSLALPLVLATSNSNAVKPPSINRVTHTQATHLAKPSKIMLDIKSSFCKLTSSGLNVSTRIQIPLLRLKKKKLDFLKALISPYCLPSVSLQPQSPTTAKGCWWDTVSDLWAQTKGKENTDNLANPTVQFLCVPFDHLWDHLIKKRPLSFPGAPLEQSTNLERLQGTFPQIQNFQQGRRNHSALWERSQNKKGTASTES